MSILRFLLIWFKNLRQWLTYGERPEQSLFTKTATADLFKQKIGDILDGDRDLQFLYSFQNSFFLNLPLHNLVKNKNDDRTEMHFQLTLKQTLNNFQLYCKLSIWHGVELNLIESLLKLSNDLMSPWL